MSLMGKGVIEVLLVIHYYEAWLAMLAIVVWHMYGVVFNPPRVPHEPQLAEWQDAQGYVRKRASLRAQRPG